MKKTFILAAAVVVALAGLAIAQTVPQVQTLNPTADRVQIIPRGAPSAGNVYASPAQITAAMGYYKSVPASLFTFTFGNAQRVAAFDPSGTLDYGYVTLAPAPSDGTEQCVFSTAAITTLYLSASAGQTLADAVTTLAANGRNCYLYGTSNATWNRSQ